MYISPVLPLLTLIAAVSPLLTFAHLWQIKEWRWDRLREHLLRGGFFRPIFGVTRPAIVGACIYIGIIGFKPWVEISLATLILLNIFQIISRKQPRPVWTQKAVALCTLSILLTLGAAAASSHSAFLPFLPLFQPFFAAASWLILFPLDRTLKKRIIRRARALREAHPDLTVIGITGSVGKTTTKSLLAYILADRSPLVTPEYMNAEIGVAQWLIRALAAEPADSRRTFIVEMGAYRRGEIGLLCSFVRPTMGIVTEVGTQHRALFGSDENIRAAKGELVVALPQDGRAFLNGDSARCRELATRAPCPVTIAGTGGPTDIEAFDIEETGNGIVFRVSETAFHVPLHGTHNVVNVLLAVAVAERLGMPLPAIAGKLRSFAPPHHTFAVREERGVTILDDTHNSSPMSFKAAIAWARARPEEPKTLLASGIIELGEIRDRVHAELGTEAAGVFDRVIFTSKETGSQFARGAGAPVEYFSADTASVPRGSLLVCAGRVGERAIERILPQ